MEASAARCWLELAAHLTGNNLLTSLLINQVNKLLTSRSKGVETIKIPAIFEVHFGISLTRNCALTAFTHDKISPYGAQSEVNKHLSAACKP